MKLQAVNYSSKLQIPNFQGLELFEGSWLAHVQCLCYILCVDFLKSLQSSVFSQPLSTAVSAYLIAYTTASFHLGKFGDDRYLSFVIEKKYSVLVRPVRRDIRLRPNIIRGMFGASLA